MKFSFKLLLTFSLISGANFIKSANVNSDFVASTEKSAKAWHQNVFLKCTHKSYEHNNIQLRLNHNCAILNNDWSQYEIINKLGSGKTSYGSESDAMYDAPKPVVDIIAMHWKYNSVIQDFELRFLTMKTDNEVIKELQKEYSSFEKKYNYLAGNWNIFFDNLIAQILYTISKDKNIEKLFSDELSQKIFASYYELAKKKIVVYWECLKLIKASKPATSYIFQSRLKQGIKSLIKLSIPPLRSKL